MPTIIKRASARTDLIEIWENIADHSEGRADKFIDQLDQKIQLLGKKPNLGQPRDELAKDLRSFPFGRYIIFFLPLADGIELIRVLHGGRDLDAIFHPEE